MPSLRNDAERLTDQVRTKMMPSWAATVDRRYGGYLLSPLEKQAATQSRMIWALSHAHRKGLGDYLDAAGCGVTFLLERLRDDEHGGFFWKTDRRGRVTSDRKILCGQLFVIYALVEYSRASGDRAALAEAQSLFDLLTLRAHDDVHGGWLEHFQRNWRPIRRVRRWTRGVEVEIPGLKSSNIHMHAFEALAELYAETRRGDVGAALAETLDLARAHFYPADPARATQHRRRDWGPAPAGRSGISYGHNIEFAWLLLRSEEVLGRDQSWGVLETYLRHALAAPAAERLWWEHAEMLAALATFVGHRSGPPFTHALQQLLEFLRAHQTDPRDGLWVQKVGADGRVIDDTKVSTWKDAYHDVRAAVVVADAFGLV